MPVTKHVMQLLQVVQRGAGGCQHVPPVIAKHVLLEFKGTARGRHELPHAGRLGAGHGLRVEGTFDKRQQRQLGGHVATFQLFHHMEQVFATPLGHALDVVGARCVPLLAVSTSSPCRSGMAKPRRMRSQMSAGGTSACTAQASTGAAESGRSPPLGYTGGFRVGALIPGGVSVISEGLTGALALLAGGLGGAADDGSEGGAAQPASHSAASSGQSRDKCFKTGFSKFATRQKYSPGHGRSRRTAGCG
jgi:hypothetical protein